MEAWFYLPVYELFVSCFIVILSVKSISVMVLETKSLIFFSMFNNDDWDIGLLHVM